MVENISSKHCTPGYGETNETNTYDKSKKKTDTLQMILSRSTAPNISQNTVCDCCGRTRNTHKMSKSSHEALCKRVMACRSSNGANTTTVQTRTNGKQQLSSTSRLKRQIKTQPGQLARWTKDRARSTPSSPSSGMHCARCHNFARKCFMLSNLLEALLVFL